MTRKHERIRPEPTEESVVANPVPLAHPIDDPPLLTIKELAAQSEVKIASIHHYRRIGLLPPPVAVSSKRLLFDQHHVEVLELIRLLRSRWDLSLASIGDLMPELLALKQSDPLSSSRWSEILTTHLEQSRSSLTGARLVAAARRSFAQEGYASAKLESICDTAGVAKGSFYLYFESKHHLFLAAALSTVDAVGEGLDSIEAPMSEGKAVAELSLLLKPFVPLYLEVMTRELRGDEDVLGVASGITEGIAGRVSPHLVARGQMAVSAGRRVAETALIGLLRPSMGIR